MGFLPLKKEPASIAVIGPNADDLDALEGNYNGTPSQPVTILAGIKKRFPNAKVNYVEGTGLVSPVQKPIPTEALCTDASCNEHGLHADYFNNMKVEGSPTLSRTDATIDFAWGDTGMSPQLLKNYSARWTGVLVPPATGDYLHRLQRTRRLSRLDRRQSHCRRLARASSRFHRDEENASRARPSIRREDRIFPGCPQRRSALHLESSGSGDEREAVEAARNADVVVVAMGFPHASKAKK